MADVHPYYYGNEKPEIDKFLDLCVKWINEKL